MTKTPPLRFNGHHINTGVAKGLIVGSHFTHVGKIAIAIVRAPKTNKRQTKDHAGERERDRERERERGREGETKGVRDGRRERL